MANLAPSLLCCVPQCSRKLEGSLNHTLAILPFLLSPLTFTTSTRCFGGGSVAVRGLIRREGPGHYVAEQELEIYRLWLRTEISGCWCDRTLTLEFNFFLKQGRSSHVATRKNTSICTKSPVLGTYFAFIYSLIPSHSPPPPADPKRPSPRSTGWPQLCCADPVGLERQRDLSVLPTECWD